MKDDVVVKLEKVSKYYKLYNSPKDRLKEALNPSRKKYHREFFALRDISLELRRGECLGVIGKNGMGKSTLLKIIANVIQPSSGSVSVNGSISALLELGTGFNPEFSGLENIYFYGTILGFGKNEIEEKVKEIIDFADIGEFINQPVKTYSSGMFVRLAFAVQTSLKTDVLLVDEVLSVGDIFFQQKCHARIEELLSKGTAIILVSHDTALIEKYADNTMILDLGSCVYFDISFKAVQKYFSFANDKNIITKDTIKEGIWEKSTLSLIKENNTLIPYWPDISHYQSQPNLSSYGDNSVAKLNSFFILNQKRIPTFFFNVGETASFLYEFVLLQDIAVPVGGLQIRNNLNLFVHGKSTLQYSIPISEIREKTPAGTIIRFRQDVQLFLSPGDYVLSIGLASIGIESYVRTINKKSSSLDTDAKVLIQFPQVGKFSIVQNLIEVDFFGYVNLPGNYYCELIYK